MELRSPAPYLMNFPLHPWKAVHNLLEEGKKSENCWPSARNHYVIQLEFDLYPPNETETDMGGKQMGDPLSYERHT